MNHSLLAMVPALEAALLSPEPAALRDWSASGRLAQVIPEWARLADPAANTQHRFHEFPLDEHTLRVVAHTKASVYYAPLTLAERRLVTMAALLHDITKRTGAPHERETLGPDPAHPVESARAACGILPGLGYGQEDVRRVALLVEHHQLFGHMIIASARHDWALPPEPVLADAAAKIACPSVLAMLRALTEGDIRGVRDTQPVFTAEVEDKLNRFSARVLDRLPL